MPSDISTFAEVARVQIFAEGENVYRQGDASEVFFVIANGEAELIIVRNISEKKGNRLTIYS